MVTYAFNHCTRSMLRVPVQHNVDVQESASLKFLKMQERPFLMDFGKLLASMFKTLTCVDV